MKKVNFRYLIFLLVFVSKSIVIADVCSDWFSKSSIKSIDKNCLSQCNVYPVDMATFACHSECEKFCKKSKCAENLYWKNKIKSGRPKDWDSKLEKTKVWLDSEKKELSKALQRLPDEFNKLDFEGFYRMEKSEYISNPGTTSLNKSIVLYDNAFVHPIYKLDRVAVHELAHVLYLSLSKKDKESYRKNLEWSDGIERATREGKFFDNDAQTSIEEDFATNIEYYFYEPEKIKSQIPKAYKWIQKMYSKQFRLKEACDE